MHTLCAAAISCHAVHTLCTAAWCRCLCITLFALLLPVRSFVALLLGVVARARVCAFCLPHGPQAQAHTHNISRGTFAPQASDVTDADELRGQYPFDLSACAYKLHGLNILT